MILLDLMPKHVVLSGMWYVSLTKQCVVPLENPHVNLLGISLVSVSHAHHC